MKNADLHMHSTASDGGYTPAELVGKCSDANLEIIALTDHDTMDGVDAAIEEGKRLGIEVIPGIEFSTKEGKVSVHVLGYGLDRANTELQQFLQEQRDLRRKRMNVMLEKFAKVGISLDEKEVLAFVDGGSIGRPHVAKALVKQGYVKDVAEAFDRFLAGGKPCYVAKEKEMTPTEAIEWIHKTGGVAILAHPIYYNLDDKIEEWVTVNGLNGVEVYHRDHDEQAITHYEQVVKQIEEQHNIYLLKTGGSDFHHEDYGRQRQPLGITRVLNRLAEELKNALATNE